MLWLMVYLIVGSTVAATTMYVFPPIEGFRPRFVTVVSACIAFTLLWPVLALLALWYQTISYVHRRQRASKKMISTESPSTEPVGPISATTKPR